MQSLIFYVIKKGPHIIQIIYKGQQNNNWQLSKLFELFIEKNVLYMWHHPKTPMPVVNNLIHSKIPWPNLWLISQCLRQGVR